MSWPLACVVIACVVVLGVITCSVIILAAVSKYEEAEDKRIQADAADRAARRRLS